MKTQINNNNEWNNNLGKKMIELSKCSWSKIKWKKKQITKIKLTREKPSPICAWAYGMYSNRKTAKQ